MLRQKSQETWLNEGDRNTNFFFTSALICKRFNRIDAIKFEDGWISDKGDIDNYFIN